MGPPTPSVDWGWGGPGGVGSKGGGLPSPGGNMLPLSPSALQAEEKNRNIREPQHAEKVSPPPTGKMRKQKGQTVLATQQKYQIL